MPLRDHLQPNEGQHGNADHPSAENAVNAGARLTAQATREVSLALARQAIAVLLRRRRAEP